VDLSGTPVGYERPHFKRAGDLLESALALEPHLGGPLSVGDLQSPALILKSQGDARSLQFEKELIRARPNLANAVSWNIDERKPLLEALITSVAPGLDIGAPITGAPAPCVDDIHQLVDSVSTAPETEDQ
jgi:hypothetical protein